MTFFFPWNHIMLEKQFVIIGNVYVPCFSESFQHYTENYRILSSFSKWSTISFILSYFYTWKDFFRTIIKHLCTSFTRHGEIVATLSFWATVVWLFLRRVECVYLVRIGHSQQNVETIPPRLSTTGISVRIFQRSSGHL